jgi:hypothetical protein
MARKEHFEFEGGRDSELDTERIPKSEEWNFWIAREMKRQTTATNSWPTIALAMGRPRRVYKLVKDRPVPFGLLRGIRVRFDWRQPDEWPCRVVGKSVPRWRGRSA